MGTARKVLCVLLRFVELCSSVIVTALLGRFFYLRSVAPGDASVEGRLIYAQVISCLEIIFSILLFLPLKYSFYAWPVDLVFFISSIVAFSLLASLDSSCDSDWYWSYWGYYWGGYWTVGPWYDVDIDIIDHAGCGGWRATLAFLFVGSMAWLLSAILGVFVFFEIREGRDRHRTRTFKEKIMGRKDQHPHSEHHDAEH